MQHPMKKFLTQRLSDLNNRIGRAQQTLQMANDHYSQVSSRFKGGMTSNTSAHSLEQNMMKSHVDALMPGNVGDINRVIWPFWFTTEDVKVAPSQAINANFTVTQEAAFVMLSMTRAVFVEESGQANAGQYQFIDPDAVGAAGKTNGLTFTIQDSQSSRSLMNTPWNINQVGYWKKPTVFPTPVLFLPNSNIEVTWQNDNQANTYRPKLTFFGYRVRIDHAKDILSTVSG